MADSYRTLIDNRQVLKQGTDSFVGTSGAGNLVALADNGLIDPSLIPSLTEEVSIMFNSVNSIASSIRVAIISYTVPVDREFFLELIEYDGTNIAVYEIEIDSVIEARKRTYLGSALSNQFDFRSSSGIGREVLAGSTITLYGEHSRPDVGDFSSRMQGIERDI